MWLGQQGLLLITTSILQEKQARMLLSIMVRIF